MQCGLTPCFYQNFRISFIFFSLDVHLAYFKEIILLGVSIHLVCFVLYQGKFKASQIFSFFAMFFSVSEFVVDFVNIMPGVPKNKVKSRIILTPQHAKRLLKALGENVARFENAHGEIKDYEQPPIPLNFGPTGQA